MPKPNAVSVRQDTVGVDFIAMEAPLNLKAARVIRVAQPSITDKELAFVTDALIANQLSAGPRTSAFEKRFANLHNRKYGVTCNSGTSALMLALRAMDIGAGHRVAMPTMTMVACANAVLSVGATPVFVDSEPETGNAVLRKRSGIDGYLAVHLYGVPAEIHGEIRQRTISDCAEAHFATYEDGKSVGSRGRLSCFSFFANKIVTTCEGGIVLTDEDETEERLKSLRAHAFTAGEHFHHKEHAYGLRMSEVSAAIGLAQLERKDALLERREKIGKAYQSLLNVWWLEPLMRPKGSAWWVYPVLIRKGTKYTRDEVRSYLHAHGVETRSFFKPMHLQPHLKEFAHGKFPVAEDLYERGFYLPLFSDMAIADVEYIANLLEAL